MMRWYWYWSVVAACLMLPLHLVAEELTLIRTCEIILGDETRGTTVTPEDLDHPHACCITAAGTVLETPRAAVSFGAKAQYMPIDAYIERGDQRLPLAQDVPLQRGDWLGIARSAVPAGVRRLWITIPYVLVPPVPTDGDSEACRENQ